MVDASKAFDRVDHTLPFEKLLQRKLPPAVVWVLMVHGAESLCSAEKISFWEIFCF